MKQEVPSDYSFDIFYLINLIFKWKWPILIISILATIVTYIFTGPKFISPEYKSTVVFYPTSNASISSTLMTEPGMTRFNLLEFGSDEDGEQILQILKSDDVKNAVIKHFNLAKHYNLDTTNGVSWYTLQTLLSKQVEVKQTEFKAIQITVYDTDAQTAADIANYMANYSGYQKNLIQKIKAKEALEIIQNEYATEKKVVDSMDRTLMKLREAGVYDYFEQSKQLNEAWTLNTTRLQQESAILKVYESNKSSLPDTMIIKAKARVKGYEAALKSIEPSMNAIKKYGGVYLDNINTLEIERKKLSSLKMRYESTKLDFEKELSQKFIINQASKPEVAARPRRMLSSGLSFVSTIFLSILLIVLIDAFPFLRNKLA